MDTSHLPKRTRNFHNSFQAMTQCHVDVAPCKMYGTTLPLRLTGLDVSSNQFVHYTICTINADTNFQIAGASDAKSALPTFF
jgi:hypothetical protein